jgi:transposase-like protein
MPRTTPKGGRPTKLNPSRIEAILQALRMGGWRGPAARQAGIAEETLAEWIKRGERAIAQGHPETLHAQLAAAIPKAEADAEALALARIGKAASEGQWTAAAWMLERKYPGRYGKRERVELTGANEGPVIIEVALPDNGRGPAK